MSARTRLLRRFQHLEDQRHAVVGMLEKHPAEALAKAPGPEAWSAAQVVLHLAMAEEGLLKYIALKREKGGHRPAGIGAPFRLALLELALWLPLKYKAPEVVAQVPPCTWQEASGRWEAARQALHAVCRELPEEHLRHDLIKHPLAGKFPMTTGLRFVQRHVAHHIPQLRRVLGDARP